MFPKINPTTTQSWTRLAAQAKDQTKSLRDLFTLDPKRVSKFSFQLDSLYFDFSKNNVSDETLKSLLTLANECQLADAISAQFDGERINETENRAVLHTELRRISTSSEFSGLVNLELEKIKSFSSEVLDGNWKGYSGKPISDVVNIGIGGSDLGPKMVTYGLRPYWQSVTPHFVSNVDGQQLSEVLNGLDPETTLFIIASKTFTTQETMTNAMSAKGWFLKSAKEEDISKHFVAVSTNKDAVTNFGINPSNMFVFWDWVGGRYSLWSTIGLSIALAVGFDHFLALLKGAERMDDHFKHAPFEENIPVISALIGIWYNNFLGYDSVAILPYDHRLRYLPSYLQQADMESNGKYVDRSGKSVNYQTGPIIWGEPGTNGQHAFYQLIHQGTKVIPCDFIAAANADHDLGDHHDKLLANFLAQSEALLTGKSKETVHAELANLNQDEIDKLLPFKIFEGNRPSTSILMDELSPFNLGQLIAYYEHKIFVQGVVWNIYSFDQWGVELGKQLAKPILSEIQKREDSGHDLSTSILLEKIQGMRK